MATETIEPQRQIENRPRKGPPARNRSRATTAEDSSRGSILAHLTSETKLFGLIVLAAEAMLGVALPLVAPQVRFHIIMAMVGLFGLVVVAAVALSAVRQGLLKRPLPEEKKSKVVAINNAIVAGGEQPALSPDDAVAEIQHLRQVLHQAPRYSTPTYYLDTNLNIIDWNVAFDLIFRPILHKIRLRHVNHFIVELANWKEVFDHARDFSEKVKEGELPLIDMEKLVYNSSAYGVVEFEKVASQLTDGNADLKAWSVALMIRRIDWETFASDLLPRLKEHKLWSIYAVSYDAVLHDFHPYRALIAEVIDGITSANQHVLDIGAGTGNVTQELLKRGHRVTAVENNQPMLEKMIAKRLGSYGRLTINKNSAENLDILEEGSFEAAVAVNVLYALDDPAACIRNVARLLKRGGVFVLSTTHSKTDLEPLLDALKQQLKEDKQFDAKEEHYRRIYEINKSIEVTIARRYSREEYEEWLQDAGFEILYNESSYLDAVVVIHARKK